MTEYLPHSASNSTYLFAPPRKSASLGGTPLLLPRIFSGMWDVCQGVHNRLNTLRLVTNERCLSHAVYPHRGAPDAGCRWMQTVCHDVPWASQCVASRLERMLTQPAHVLRLSKTVSTHAVSPHEFFVSSSTRLETMTCYLQTSYLETRKTVLPSVCLETTFLRFEIP